MCVVLVWGNALSRFDSRCLLLASLGFTSEVASEHEDILKETLESLISAADEAGDRSQNGESDIGAGTQRRASPFVRVLGMPAILSEDKLGWSFSGDPSFGWL